MRDWDGDLHLKLYEGAKKEENKKSVEEEGELWCERGASCASCVEEVGGVYV